MGSDTAAVPVYAKGLLIGCPAVRCSALPAPTCSSSALRWQLSLTPDRECGTIEKASEVGVPRGTQPLSLGMRHEHIIWSCSRSFIIAITAAMG